MNLTLIRKQSIDQLSYIALLEWTRRGAADDPWLAGQTGQYWRHCMTERRKELEKEGTADTITRFVVETTPQTSVLITDPICPLPRTYLVELEVMQRVVTLMHPPGRDPREATYLGRMLYGMNERAANIANEPELQAPKFVWVSDTPVDDDQRAHRKTMIAIRALSLACRVGIVMQEPLFAALQQAYSRQALLVVREE